MIKFHIKEKVDERGWSTAEFAKRLGVGMTSAYKYYNMQAIPLNVLERIAAVFECPIKELFSEEWEHGEACAFVWDDSRERRLRVIHRVLDSISREIDDITNDVGKIIDDSCLQDN